jgi:tol-pal system protein YbgF
MYFRAILSGTLAAMLLSGTAAFAQPGEQDRPGIVDLLPKIGLPGVFGSKEPDETVRYAQVADPRVVALEEQIRSLSGTIEELNFQILQMQEQMRKMQEDNEFRFQELEKRSDARAGKGDRSVAQAPAARQEPPAGGAPAAQSPGSIEEVITGDAGQDPNAPGAPPKTFGTLTIDENGNVKDGSIDSQATQGVITPPPANGAAPAKDGAVVAALPATDDPEELYRNSYEFILSGDYSTAEAGFRDHIARFPSDPKTADSHFWLGESLLGQQKYRDAAEVFLAANKNYPDSKKAPDMLLKLGVSLVGLNQRDVACATFAEIGKRYPNISGALKGRVKQEQALAAC